MADVLDRLRADLTTAMKARQTLQVRVIRAALTAIQTEQVATAEARELSRDEEQAVLTREVRKRKESAELYQQGGRPELAEAELAEVQVLEAYLPAALSEAEIDQIVVEAVAAAGPQASLRQMGQIMKTITARTQGRADGSVIAAKVKAMLSQH
jgi:hypothetical protein